MRGGFVRAARAVVAPSAVVACHATFVFLQVLTQLFAFFERSVLVLRPPRPQFLQFLTGLFAQQQKIVSRAEARVLQQFVGAATLSAWQLPLLFPNFLHRQREATRDTNQSCLFADHFGDDFL